VDDKTLYDYKSYREHVLTDAPSPYAVRWISIIRQWCLPLLFWVSGAAAACSYRGGMPRGIDKLLGFTCLGMLFNAGLWLLSPMITYCTVDSDKPECKGILFNFSICGGAGWWFAVVFQMWYTLVLMGFSLMSWPLFATVHGSVRTWALTIQWVLNMLLISFFVLASGGACPDPIRTLLQAGALEVAFLVLVAMDAPLAEWLARPSWLPVRVLHYLMALVALLEFGALPYAAEMKNIGPAYLAFIVTGFKQFFRLGFVMTHARVGPAGDRAEPLVSTVWPVILIVMTFVAPSTNFDAAGMLTYPYYSRAVDRCLYVAGSLVLTFVLDRASRGVRCRPLPNVLGHTSLLLYLFHPVLITVLLALGLRSLMLIWLGSCAVMLLAVAALLGVQRQLGGRRQRGPQKVAQTESRGKLDDVCSSSDTDGV